MAIEEISKNKSSMSEVILKYNYMYFEYYSEVYLYI